MVIGVLLGLFAGVCVALVVVAVALQRSRTAARLLAADAASQRQGAVDAAIEALATERDLTLDAALASVSADRDAVVRSAVEAVLAVAGEKLADHRDHTERSLDLRTRSFEQQVSGMNDELRRVQDLLGQMGRQRAQQHGQVVQGLEQAAQQSRALAETTHQLRRALANARARGQWGERMADDVLRTAGFVEGVNYRKQTAVPGGGIPDVTFLLPNDRVLHMDVKFPIDNYLRYLEAADDAVTDPAAAARADAARAQFLKDVRQRVREVTTRAYVDPETTLGYVLLFIPNEAVYAFVHEQDPALLDTGLAHNVVLCSPLTLFAVLGVVRQAVDSVELARTSDEILRCLGSFRAQWDRFSEQIDKLGRQFAGATRAYDELAGTRRRQLERSLDAIDQLRHERGLTTGEADGADADVAVDVDHVDDDHPVDHRGPGPMAGGDDGDAPPPVPLAVGSEPFAPATRRRPTRLRPVRNR